MSAMQSVHKDELRKIRKKIAALLSNDYAGANVLSEPKLVESPELVLLALWIAIAVYFWNGFQAVLH